MKEKVRFVIFEEPKLPVPKNAHHVTVPVTYIASCTTGNFGSSVCRVNVHTGSTHAANAECHKASGLRDRMSAAVILPWLSVTATQPCGIPAHRSTADGRSYIVRLPSVCAQAKPLPFIVLVHCFGCTADMEIDKFAAVADARGVGLVAPEGIGSSFHAPHCCGPALNEKIDDVSFIDGIVAALIAEGLAEAHSISVSGFSNGGFMASHLVDPASKSRTQWAAVATAAGHEYGLTRADPLPVSIHHCRNDAMVNTSGCCARSPAPAGELVRQRMSRSIASPSSTCCCGIQADTCESVQEQFRRWAQVNRCKAFRTVAGPGNSRCKEGVGCAAPTQLCLYENGCYHSQWARAFPSAAAVVDHLLVNHGSIGAGHGGVNHGSIGAGHGEGGAGGAGAGLRIDADDGWPEVAILALLALLLLLAGILTLA